MQVSCTTSQSFGRVSLSSKAFFNISSDQIKLYNYAYDAVEKNQNLLHFDMGANKELILAVFDTTGKFVDKFLGSSKEAVDKAIKCCLELPEKSKDYGKCPVSFEKFIEKMYS